MSNDNYYFQTGCMFKGGAINFVCSTCSAKASLLTTTPSTTSTVGDAYNK